MKTLLVLDSVIFPREDHQVRGFGNGTRPLPRSTYLVQHMVLELKVMSVVEGVMRPRGYGEYLVEGLESVHGSSDRTGDASCDRTRREVLDEEPQPLIGGSFADELPTKFRETHCCALLLPAKQDCLQHHISIGKV